MYDIVARPQLSISPPGAPSSYQQDSGNAVTPGLTPDDSIPTSSSSCYAFPYGPGRDARSIPEGKEYQQHVFPGQPVGAPELTGRPTSRASFEPPSHEPGVPPFIPPSPGQDVEATDDPPLDIVNPFELTIAQGPTRAVAIFGFLVRVIYLWILLFVPRLYFSRVERILKGAEMSMDDMENMVVMGLGKWNRRTDRIPVYIQNSPMYPHFMQFNSSWEFFINSLMKEWKTFNIVSILLSTALLTLLQIDTAASDPLIRNSALMSLICALMSLLYACIYIVRFAIMKKAHKALEWAEEAKHNGGNVLWNVFVLLALPAIWLSWALILFMTSIMTFTWRIGSKLGPLSAKADCLGRVTTTGFFFIGMLYLTLVLLTLRTYGREMDKKWRGRVEGWTKKHRPDLMFGPAPGQYLLPPGCTPQFGNPPQLPSAGAYSPYYPGSDQPMYTWVPAGNQPMPDPTFSQTQRNTPFIPPMNDGAHPSFPPGRQPLHATQDYNIRVDPPSDLGSGSPGYPPHSPYPDLPPVTAHPFRQDTPLPASPDTYGMMELRTFPVSSTQPSPSHTPPLPPLDGNTTPPRPSSEVDYPHSTGLPSVPTHGMTAWDYQYSPTTPTSPGPPSYTFQRSATAPVYLTPHGDAQYPNWQAEPATGNDSPSLTSSSSPEAPLYAPQPSSVARAQLRDILASVPQCRLPTAAAEARGVQSGRDQLHSSASPVQQGGGQVVRQGVIECAAHGGPTFLGLLKWRHRADSDAAIRPYCARSAASLVGNIAMGPTLAATRGRVYLGAHGAFASSITAEGPPGATRRTSFLPR